MEVERLENLRGTDVEPSDTFDTILLNMKVYQKQILTYLILLVMGMMQTVFPGWWITFPIYLSLFLSLSLSNTE